MHKSSSTRQIYYLFFCSYLVLFVGMGLFPVLPLYAAHLGATRAMAGAYFAVMYASHAAGPLLTSWLAGRVRRKTLFVAAGILAGPALVLIGQTTVLWQVMVLTSIVWFCGGVCMALASVLTGLHSAGNRRGRSFSLMSLAVPLGSLTGGLVVGYLVHEQGYPAMFAALGVLWMLLPVVGLFGLQDRPTTPPPRRQAEKAGLGRPFHLLLLLALLASMAISIDRLGTSLSMQDLDYPAAAVVSTATVSGLVAIPVTLLIGTLSDRLGRKRFLILSYLVAGGAALMLSVSTQLWHFWLAATGMLVATCVNGAVTAALATDILPPASLIRGLPLLSVANSLASIVTFAVLGLAMDTLGPAMPYIVAAALAVAAAVLLSSLRTAPPQPVMPALRPECQDDLVRLCL